MVASAAAQPAAMAFRLPEWRARATPRPVWRILLWVRCNKLQGAPPCPGGREIAIGNISKTNLVGALFFEEPELKLRYCLVTGITSNMCATQSVCATLAWLLPSDR